MASKATALQHLVEIRAKLESAIAIAKDHKGRDGRQIEQLFENIISYLDEPIKYLKEECSK